MVNLDVPPKVLISAEKIAERVKEIAAEISEKYRGTKPLVISTLTGSVFFVTDLLRDLDFPLELDFVKASSYGSSDVSSGKINIHYMPRISLEGRRVIICEDIVDTGQTLASLKKAFEELHPLSIETCTLLDKPSRRVIEIKADYVGFTIPDKFVVGYGLDYDNQYRYLPDVCYFE